MVNRFDEEDTQEQESTLLTIKEFSKALRIDMTTTRRWIADGTLDAITLPHRGNRRVYRIKQATLDGLLEGKRS